MLAQTDAVTASSLMQAVGQARPSASHARPQLAVAYVAPGGEVERTIAAVWQEAFGLEQVGIHDNFFELAGNSLLAIQIVTRLRDILRVQLPLTSLFDAPTISQLAQAVAAQRSSNTEESEASRLLSEIEVFTLAEVEEILAREVAPHQDGFGVGSGNTETV
jgi:acyl carrier protein